MKQALGDFGKVIRDSITVARMRLHGQIRARSWLIGVSAAGFLLVTPFLLLGKTIVGENQERSSAR